MENNEGKEEVEIVELVELEVWVKTDKPAPHAKQYAFKVDKQRIVVDKPKLDGKEILAKVDKTPEKYKLYQHKKGHQPELIEAKQIVDLQEKGVERFSTMARDTTEGREGGPCTRQDFRLPEADEAYLDDLGLKWEMVLDAQTRWLLIHGWVLPNGYNHEQVSVGLLIPPSYSDSQIDMVYFKPHLARTDGKPIGALCAQPICGEAWQRWSRHRSGANPWRPGIDDVASHLVLVDDWVRREFEK